mmetsp:Transcript_1252/g.3617  ORF Transcript_1252/g.3617 Transcript_1252/m.3617 type:complete len:91 (+) Transcript_1252:323-595(+)
MYVTLSQSEVGDNIVMEKTDDALRQATVLKICSSCCHPASLFCSSWQHSAVTSAHSESVGFAAAAAPVLPVATALPADGWHLHFRTAVAP